MLLSKKIVSFKSGAFTPKVKRKNVDELSTDEKIKKKLHFKNNSQGCSLNLEEVCYLPADNQLDCKAFIFEAICHLGLRKGNESLKEFLLRGKDSGLWKIMNQDVIESQFDEVLEKAQTGKMIIIGYGNKSPHSIALRRISTNEFEVYDINLYVCSLKSYKDPIKYTKKQLWDHLKNDIETNYDISSNFTMYSIIQK